MKIIIIHLVLVIYLITSPCFCWFQTYETIKPIDVVAGLPNNVKSMGELIEFDDFTFGISYIASDDFAYAAFIKHGVLLQPPTKVTEEQTVYQTKGCNYNNQQMLVQSMLGVGDVNDRVVVRLISKDGTMHPQVEVTIKTGVTGNSNSACAQVKDKIFIGHYYETNSKVDAYMNLFDPATNTLETELKVNNQVVGDQYGIKFAPLQGDNLDKVLLIYRDEPNGLFMQLLDESGTVLKRGQLVQNVNAKFYDIASMEDGGFVANYIDNAGQPTGNGIEGNGCFVFRFDKNLNQLCTKKIHQSLTDLRSMFVYKNTMLYNYMGQGAPYKRFWTMSVNLETCEEFPEEIPYDNEPGESNVSSSLSKSKGDDSYIIGIVTIANGANKNIMYGEYYLDQFNNCTPHGCSNCVGHTDPCPVCQGSTSEFREIRTKSAGDCSCKDGYYDDINEFDCQQCSYQCATCSGNASTCGVCQTTGATNRDTSAHPCLCLPSHFDKGTIACEACDNLCKECKDIATNCTECKSDTRLTPTCACKLGFYEATPPEEACSACHHSCTACSVDATTCTLCSDSNRQGVNCECKTGYFNDGTNPICQKCDESCLSCAGDSITCTQCKDNTTRSGNNCACKTGLYETGGGGKCIDYCSSRCDDCTGRFDNCTSCASTRSDSAAPACSKCNDGFYEQGDDPFQYCLMCKSSCKTCENGSVCTQCVSDDLLLPNCINLSQGYTTVQLPDGTISDIKCDPKCKTCTTNPSACGSCQGLNREKDCSCAVGFHDFEQTIINCIQCPTLCSSCINPTHCTGCSGANFELNSNNLCICKAGYTNLGGTCIEECGNDKYWRNGKCNPCFFYQTDICMEACPSHATKKGQQCVVEEISSTVIFIIIVICIVGVFLLAVVAKRVINNQRQNKYKSLKIVQNGNNNNNNNDLQHFQSEQPNQSSSQLQNSGERANSKESESIVN